MPLLLMLCFGCLGDFPEMTPDDVGVDEARSDVIEPSNKPLMDLSLDSNTPIPDAYILRDSRISSTGDDAELPPERVEGTVSISDSAVPTFDDGIIGNLDMRMVIDAQTPTDMSRGSDASFLDNQDGSRQQQCSANQRCACGGEDCNIGCVGEECTAVCLVGSENCAAYCGGNQCRLACEEDAICQLQCEGQRCENICENRAECTQACHGDRCGLRCRNQSQCQGDCEGGNCQVRCDSGSSCVHTCRGDGCSFACGRQSNCDFACEGQGCSADCRGADSCKLVCRGNDCGIHCGDLSEENCQFDCEGNRCRRN